MPFDAIPVLKREKRLILLSFCVLIAIPVVLFWHALAERRLIYGYDTIALGLPFHAEVLRSLAAHQWPLWFPDVLGGMPGLASCNLLFAYPTDCIGSLFGMSLQALLGLDATVHVALAGMGMFLFLRRLGRSASACLLGGLFFALSGSVVSQIYGGYFNFVEGIAVVPWAFWAAHKGREDGDWFAWGLCGLVFALQILAGASQLCVYTVIAVALFVLAAPPIRRGQTRSPAPPEPVRRNACMRSGVWASPWAWPFCWRRPSYG